MDDAATFPPGNADLPDALSAHHAHQQSGYADLLGSFVLPDTALPDLAGAGPLAVAVVVKGGAGALEPAARWAQNSEEVRLVSLETSLRDETDLAHNARRFVAARDHLLAQGHIDEDVALYVEPPRLFARPPSHTWNAALDELAASELRLKFRTGGPDADDFPAASELADCIEAALDREVPFKLTAGLHHALRSTAAGTGFQRHGFLNVLAATRLSLDGAPRDDVAGVLEERDAATILGLLADAGEQGLVSARRWFTSFGSCSVLEPLEDLVALGLLPNLPEQAS